MAWGRGLLVFITDPEATLEEQRLGFIGAPAMITHVMKLKEVLTSLVLFVVLGTWVIRLEFISLALNKEGYFNTEKERLFGSLKWTQPYRDQTVPPGGQELFMLQMFLCGFCRCLIFICYLFKTAHFLGASKLFLLYFFLETSKHQLIEMNFMPALGFSPSKLHIYRE